MKSRGLTWGVIGGTLLLTGMLTRPLADPVWQQLRAGEPALNLRSVEGTLGQGVSVGLLGGFRAIVADFLWLKTNSVWEDRDLPATQTLVGLVTAVDPRPLYFWLNGARMIAYDMPAWRIEAAGGYREVPATEQRRIDAEQAEVAFDLLARALRYHPGEPLLILEIGHIHRNRLKDVATAARFYRQAAERPDAPYYAARLYAEQLRLLGRQREAYDWLRELHPKLPPDDLMAMAPHVLQRIRELEDELGIPPPERYESPVGSQE